MNTIPKELLKAAQAIAQAQNALACSPAQQRVIEGTVMCAASCVAYASIQQRKGLEVAAAFKDSLILNNGFETLYYAFEEIGLSRNLCKRMHVENDERSESNRLSWFLNLNSFSA